MLQAPINSGRYKNQAAFYNLAAYDLGTMKTQFVVAGGITYHF